MPTVWPIVFMGTPEPAAATLKYLMDGPDPIAGIVTQPERPAGRGQKRLASPVYHLANASGLPVAAPEKIRDPAFFKVLQEWKPQLIVVVAYGRILPLSVLQLAPYGCLNVHYSLLPKYRGAAPAAWTIINGEQSGGVTTMQLAEKMDAGPIYLQEEVALTEDETTGSLQTKLTPIGARLLLETIRRMKEGTIVPRAQDEAQVSFAPIIKKADGLIDWTRRATEIERRVRGFYPWPGSYTYLHGKLLKVHRAKIISSELRSSPGDVIKADHGGFWVATGSGAFGLEEVQLENKKRMSGVEFIRGARIKTGDRLG
ncbi:MAG: methionyl-tRNA formyltransferase [Alphaproteobacteria bacterium]